MKRPTFGSCEGIKHRIGKHESIKTPFSDTVKLAHGVALIISFLFKQNFHIELLIVRKLSKIKLDLIKRHRH